MSNHMTDSMLPQIMPKTTLKRTSPYYAGPHNMQSTHALTRVLLCPLSMSRLMDDVVLLLV